MRRTPSGTGAKEEAQYSLEPPASPEAQAAHEMASSGRVTANCSVKKRLHTMACIPPPPTKTLSDNSREDIQ